MFHKFELVQYIHMYVCIYVCIEVTVVAHATHTYILSVELGHSHFSWENIKVTTGWGGGGGIKWNRALWFLSHIQSFVEYCRESNPILYFNVVHVHKFSLSERV